MLVPVVLLAIIAWLSYKLWTWNYNYWEARGFPCLKAKFPWGSNRGLAWMDSFQGDATQEVFDALAPHPYGGVVILRRPYLFVRDPDIVKHIFIKDFSSFRDRITIDNIHEPESHHLFNLGWEKWRVKRVHLGPIFSAGKMKAIFSLYESIQPELYRVLDEITGKPFDAKDTFSRFTIDFIGSWTFGSKVNTLKDPEHVLKKEGVTMFPVLTKKTMLKLNTYNIFTDFQKYSSFAYIPPKLGSLVSEIIASAIRARENTSAKITDFIDTLTKLKQKGTLSTDKVMTDDSKVYELSFDVTESDLASEALILFTAGFDTTSTAISLTLWEMTQNETLQQELRKEIHEKIEEYGSITYQALQSMELLDRVINETNRKYAIVPVLYRICTQKYRMPDNPDLILEPGTRVIIPMWSIHRDPDLYPDPDVYDPDRFLPDRAPTKPGMYFPFADGPRYCIGKRIGLLQAKMGVALTLSRYNVMKNEKTPKELKFEPTMLVLTMKTPILLTLQPLPETNN